MTKKMTLTDKLYAMRPAELIKYAENLGVKLPQDKAGKNLKCSREKAVTRVIEAEMAARNAKPATAEESVVEQPVAEVETASDGTPYAEVMTEIVAGAEKKAEAAKKEHKQRAPMDRSAQRHFEEQLTDLCAKHDITEKRWDKIQNLVALRVNGKKTFAEIRFTGKGFKLNITADTAEAVGFGYTLQNNYYLPATCAVIAYDASDAFSVLVEVFDTVKAEEKAAAEAKERLAQEKQAAKKAAREEAKAARKAAREAKKAAAQQVAKEQEETA